MAHFPIKAIWWAQLLKLILGIALVLGAKTVLTQPMTALVWLLLGPACPILPYCGCGRLPVAFDFLLVFQSWETNHKKREELRCITQQSKIMTLPTGRGFGSVCFVSGCTHRCPGCFNEVAWDFEYGEVFTQETIDEIIAMLKPDFIQGLTLLGGEPFEPQNQPDVVKLLRQVKAACPQKSIWAFSRISL